jgi:membrane protease YdiL (CAAX protease family)
MKRLFNRLLDYTVREHWRAIDRDTLGKSTGPRSAEFKAIVTVFVSALVLTCLQYIVLRPPMQIAVSTQLPELVGRLFSDSAGEWLAQYRPLLRNASWSLGCVFFYFVIPSIVVKLLFRERLRDWGLSFGGYVRHLWIYAVLYIPVAAMVWLVSYSDAFQQSYPFYKNPQGMRDFLVWEAFYALQFCSLEFFFRGFMLSGLKERFGSSAILLMIIPYCMIHFQKPMIETLGAIVAGLILGLLAMRTRSVWGGATIHVGVAVWMDVAALVQSGGLPH